MFYTIFFSVAMPIVQPQLAAYTVNEADTPVIICVEALNIVAQTEVGFSTSDDTATGKHDPNYKILAY